MSTIQTAPTATASTPWRAAAPQAWATFDTIERLASTTVDATIMKPVRAAIAANIGFVSGGAGPGDADPADADPADADPAADQRVAVCVDFAEQFVVDVAGTTDAQRHALMNALGADVLTFVQTLYVTDVFSRAHIALSRLFDEPLVAGVSPAAVDTVATIDTAGTSSSDLWTTLERFMQQVACLTALDPLTSELVRLSGARVHNCRLCQSRRSVKAIDIAAASAASAGVDLLDALADDDHAIFSERQRVALRLTEALVTQPQAIDAALATAVHAHFSTAEISEILLDVVRNAANKIAVAFGADAPVVTEGVEFYDIDAQGDVIADVDVDVVRAATVG